MKWCIFKVIVQLRLINLKNTGQVWTQFQSDDFDKISDVTTNLFFFNDAPDNDDKLKYLADLSAEIFL